ncbi:MAG: glycosyltransferase family 2 protein [archaeon]
MQLSAIVPAYNEEHTIQEITSRLLAVFKKAGLSGEVILVDDGSTDRTLPLAKELASKHRGVRVLANKTNIGKSAALTKGFRAAKGDYVLFIDADLQQDPEDIPKFISLLKKYDVVNGWRADRKDPMGKKFSSYLYNRLARFLFGIKVHDFNCGMKAFRRAVTDRMNLRKDEHRNLLILASEMGYSVGEVKINHHPRAHGKSKYGITRLLIGFLTLAMLKFRLKFDDSPVVFYTIVSGVIGGLGFLFGVYLLYEKFFLGQAIGGRPLLLFSVLLMLSGLQIFLFGVLADSITYLRKEIQEK